MLKTIHGFATKGEKICYKHYKNLHNIKEKMDYTKNNVAKNLPWICNNGRKDLIQTFQEFAQYKGKKYHTKNNVATTVL
jgi:hypothetical protein